MSIAEHKFVQPTHQMTFLGILFDGMNLTMAVTEDRLQEISKELEGWKDRKKATKRQIQSLAGKQNFCAKCCKPGRVFMSRILATLKGLRHASDHVYLNGGFRKDVMWWYTLLPHFRSVSVIKQDIPT